MTKKVALNQLCCGECARVIGLSADGSTRRRLQDIGLVPGTSVTCLQLSPLGDPVAYAIRGAVIALRCEDSGKVLVESEGR
ncbi:MAG: FeoA family protein [Clostridia bacterium]